MSRSIIRELSLPTVWSEIHKKSKTYRKESIVSVRLWVPSAVLLLLWCLCWDDSGGDKYICTERWQITGKNKNIKWLLKVWQDYELQESLQCSLALAFGWWWATVSSHNFQTTLCAPFMRLLSSWKRRVSLRGQTMPAKCLQQHNKATGSPHFSFNLPPISIYVHIPINSQYNIIPTTSFATSVHICTTEICDETV